MKVYYTHIHIQASHVTISILCYGSVARTLTKQQSGS
jgi:hypothetical protein